MNIKKLSILLVAGMLIINACSDSHGVSPEKPILSTVYVTNEGNFGDSNGSVTSFNVQTGTTIQQAFSNANGRPLAGIIQSASVMGDRLYLVLNSADKIEVVDAKTFASIATIPLSKTPVSIIPAGDNKAYVSNLYDNSVSVMDLTNLEETGTTIPTGQNPQAMAKAGDRVYVANNGFGNDSTITVINTTSDTVEKNITVGHGPVDMQVDANNHIWVSCNGLIAYDQDFNRTPENDIPGSVYILDGYQASVITSIPVEGHPGALTLDDQDGRAYLLNDGVEVINMNTQQMENVKFSERMFNAVAYSAADQLLYFGQSHGYTQSGQALRFKLSGAAVDSFATGIAPNGFTFLQNE